MRCFVDMDGVLVNLRQRVAECFGQAAIDELNGSVTTDVDLWSLVDTRFWATLDWTEDGVEILNVLESYFDPSQITFCTKPTKFGTSHAGKLLWIQKHLPAHYQNSYMLIREKARVASPDIVLVDDCHKNIDAFVKAGGKGVLVPRAWNRDGEYHDVPSYLNTVIRSNFWSELVP